MPYIDLLNDYIGGSISYKLYSSAGEIFINSDISSIFGMMGQSTLHDNRDETLTSVDQLFILFLRSRLILINTKTSIERKMLKKRKS
uniref:Uncharacterized protein n=1 Tax=Glossina brevipalpis TaxID=37001 RepID=A0A1A9WBU7_9MUSC